MHVTDFRKMIGWLLKAGAAWRKRLTFSCRL